MKMVGGTLLLLLFGTGARGVQLSVSPSDRTLRAASVQRWNQVNVPARRGEILDRDGKRLATSVDTLVESVHFPEDAFPEDLAWRCVAISASDLAAMGARPLGMTLSLTLPEADELWLRAFSEGLGSIDSHSHEATALGLDTIWWSDHDFRISTYHHATTFGFEKDREPVDTNEAWVARTGRERLGKKHLVPQESDFLDDGRHEGHGQGLRRVGQRQRPREAHQGRLLRQRSRRMGTSLRLRLERKEARVLSRKGAGTRK